jgi:uncharacterized protein YggE
VYVVQSIQHPLGVTVFGSHTLAVEPDRATISFAVVHTADRPEAAFAEVEKSRGAVAQVLAGRKLAAADVTTSRVSMELAVEGYGKDRQVLGYRGQVEYDVTTRELDDVQALIVELVGAGARAIRRVRYATSQLRALRARAREQALASARIKAEGYARAAGVTLGRPIHIEDVDPSQVRGGGHGADVDLTGHDEIDERSAGSLEIAAAVLVCYSIAS